MSFPIIGVIGAGQLARMMQPYAIELGITLKLLAADPNESAAQVIPQVTYGNFRDYGDLVGFAKQCDVITFDHEHVPTEHLARLEAAGICVRPGPHALIYAQDKALMRKRLSELGLPVPRWQVVTEASEISEFLEQTPIPNGDGTAGQPEIIAKTIQGGYDGRGVRVVANPSDIADWLAHGDGVLLEEKVDFVRELAALVVRHPAGELKSYPVVQTQQELGMCRDVLVPAPTTPQVLTQAGQIAQAVAVGLDVTGVLAVEMFEARDGRILINELAMRPHNSGHWSMDAAVTSQFENHLRAVSGLPLGETGMTAPRAVMRNILGGEQPDLASRLPLALATHPRAKVHLYGKSVQPRRKIGHVNLSGTAELTELLQQAQAVGDVFETAD